MGREAWLQTCGTGLSLFPFGLLPVDRVPGGRDAGKLAPVLHAESQAKDNSLEIKKVEKLFPEEVHFNMICERQRAKAGRRGTSATPPMTEGD